MEERTAVERSRQYAWYTVGTVLRGKLEQQGM